MDYLTYAQKTERIKFLAERKMTGSLKNLADKLEVSKSTAKRMVTNLRNTGIEIKFSRVDDSYILRKE